MSGAVLFDYGGTLDGAGSHWFDRFVGLYRELGINQPEAEIKRAFYQAESRILADGRTRTWELAKTIEQHVAIQLDVLGLAKGGLGERLVSRFMAESRVAWQVSSRVLQSLASNFKLGVVSNFYGNLETVLAEAGLIRYFDAVIDSEVAGVRKPDRAIFALALSQLEIAPARSVFVGDSLERDIKPAKELGMRTVWIVPNEARGRDAAEADWRITSLTDLEGLPL